MSKNVALNIFTGQFLHYAALTLLLVGIWYAWCEIGSPYPLLFWITIAIPILHQFFVWISWRTELNSKAVSRYLGFKAYRIIFFILLTTRPISLLALAWFDQNSMGLNLIPRTLISVVLFVPAMYTIYSVTKYFGFRRAVGADHFVPKYRNMPLVKKGIFKYSQNSMYTFGFLMFWAIAFAFDSEAGLLTSAFVHTYIWVHYFATEKPDMDFLYGAEN